MWFIGVVVLIVFFIWVSKQEEVPTYTGRKIESGDSQLPEDYGWSEEAWES